MACRRQPVRKLWPTTAPAPNPSRKASTSMITHDSARHLSGDSLAALGHSVIAGNVATPRPTLMHPYGSWLVRRASWADLQLHLLARSLARDRAGRILRPSPIRPRLAGSTATRRAPRRRRSREELRVVVDPDRCRSEGPTALTSRASSGFILRAHDHRPRRLDRQRSAGPVREAEQEGLAMPSTAKPDGNPVTSPVGVRNSDHALDLRIRSERQRRASDSKEAREASVRHSDSPSLAAELPECGAVPCKT